MVRKRGCERGWVPCRRLRDQLFNLRRGPSKAGGHKRYAIYDIRVLQGDGVNMC